MSTSRIPAVIAELLDRFAAAATLQGVRIVDGPPVTGDPLREAVYVGYDGDPDGEGTGAEFTQEWASIGQRARGETFSVTCAVVVWRGSTKVAPVRVRAFEVLAAVEDLVRADPSLGQPPPTVAAFASGSLVQSQRASGMECRIPFQIQCQTRI
ncbi:hypothetical protein [Nonomuraea ceibae]|uniref:hypothetical protein n=1 Tax=Nonomuraea ceibae TaxID=1935170 RepID=UPI001C607320|nr:hypothetical protein [Nonomuraea ceibae]